MTSSHLQQMETQTPPLDMLESGRDLIETRNFQTGTEAGRVETAAYDNQEHNTAVNKKRTSFDIASGGSATDEAPGGEDHDGYAARNTHGDQRALTTNDRNQETHNYASDQNKNSNDQNNGNSNADNNDANKRRKEQKNQTQDGTGNDLEGEQEPRTNSKLAQNGPHDLQMSFQMNQNYDNLAMTQQREKLTSSQLDRKPIDVAAAQSKFRVTIEQGSVDSKESVAHLHHRMPKKPTLMQGVYDRETRGTGTILVQHSTRGFTNQVDQSQQSTAHRSFEVNPPRYHSTRPRVTIEANTLVNQDLHQQLTGMVGGGGAGVNSPQLSPNRYPSVRKMTEIQTAKVPFDGATVLTKEQERPIYPEQLSPTLRGAKLNMKKQASVRAIRGVMQSSSPRNQKLMNQQYQGFSNQFAKVQNNNSPKKKAQLYNIGGNNGPQQLHHQSNASGQYNQLDPFENVLNGQKVVIAATPASQFIQQRKQQLVNMGVANTRMMQANNPSATLSMTVGGQVSPRQTLQSQFPIAEVMSRETPDIDPDPTSNNLRGSPQYYTKPMPQPSTTAEPKRIQYQNSLSYRGTTTINSMTSSKKKMQNTTARQTNKFSKDLEVVINNRSEGDNSSINKDKMEPGEDEEDNEQEKQQKSSKDSQQSNQSPTFFSRSMKNEDMYNPTQKQLQIQQQHSTEFLKKNLIEFHNNHSLKVKASEKQMLELFPEIANHQQIITQNQIYTSNIPRIDMMINEQQIGKNPPASGIRIFEEHNNQTGATSPVNGGGRTRQSNKSLSPSQKSVGGAGYHQHHPQNAEEFGAMVSDVKQQQMLLNGANPVKQQATVSQKQLSYQVAPLQGSPSKLGPAIMNNATSQNNLKNHDSYNTLPLDVGSPTIHNQKQQIIKRQNDQQPQAEEGKSDSSLNNRAPVGYQLTINEHKRVMQTFSPNKVAPDLSMALRAEGINNSRLEQQNQQSPSNDIKGGGRVSSLNKKKLTVQIEQGKKMIKNQQEEDFAGTQKRNNAQFDLTQRFEDAENQRQLVDRKNTEVLGTSFGGTNSQAKIGRNTIQKVMDIQENLNVTIQNENNQKQRKEQDRESGASVLEQIHDSVYREPPGMSKKQAKERSSGQVDQQIQALDDAVTLEQKESAMARYLEMQQNMGHELRITATSKNNAFNLTNNMMNLRQMQPKEASVFPLEAPPVKSTQRFNVTQFRKQMQMIDTNAKFNMSFLASPKQNPNLIGLENSRNNNGQYPQKTFQNNVLQSPTTDMRIKINHRQQKTGISMGLGSLGFNKQTIADRIREVKENHQYSGSPNLMQQQPVTSSNFSPSQRSRSIDIRNKRQSNPFSVGGVHTLQSPIKGGSQQQQTLINDVVKRFKNQSDREAPANHISDKVYAVAQNQSQYNNSYQYIKVFTNGNEKNQNEHGQGSIQKHRAQLSQSVNSGQRTSQQNLIEGGTSSPNPNDFNPQIRVRNKYYQRKLSQLERPTQLEIGGEGAPMLSLLPPLKTREISPKYNYTVGKLVKEQQTSMANLRLAQEQESQLNQENAKGGKRNGQGRSKNDRKSDKKSNQKPKIIHVPNTKIIISQSGDSPLMRNYTDNNINPSMIHNHPVMIKAVASQKSLINDHSQGTPHANRDEKNKTPKDDDALVNEIVESAKGAQDLDLSLDLSTANYLQNEYRDVFLVNGPNRGHGLGPLHINPMDASLNEKLAEMASRVYKDVVVPQNQHKEDDPVSYERRELNIDGTWKEHRYNRNFNMIHQTPGGPGFHFLEYAKSNFRNPLELIQQHNAAVGGVSTTVAQTQQLAFDSYDHIATKGAKPRRNQSKRGKSRTKRGHHSQTYVDEKFSLKVQKKPINGLQHIKVEQADGPGGIKLYSIKVQQKGPRFLSNPRGVRDSIEGAANRKETLNTTRHWQDQTIDRKTMMNETKRWQEGFDQEILSPSPSDVQSRVQMVAREIVGSNTQMQQNIPENTSELKVGGQVDKQSSDQ